MQAYLNEGDRYYAMRAEGATGDRVTPENILTAIALYRMALDDSTIAEQAALKILQSYYFQGCYAFMDKDDRLRIHTQAIEFGNRYYARFPHNPAIGYWYAVNLSLWAKEKGPLQAVREGVAERIRRIAETGLALTAIDPVDKAGAYQILGRMHQLLPRIPLILTWPDKKMAEAYLKKSIEVAPEDLSSYLFLGELMRDQGRHLEAARLIAPLLARPPRESERLEDGRNLWKLKELNATLRLSSEEKVFFSMSHW